MNYNGIDCPVCKQKFEPSDDIVVCPVCGTPHHRNCWNETGKCVNEEKHSEGFIWQQMNTDTPVTKKTESDKKICHNCGHENDKIEPVCTNCGERLKSNIGRRISVEIQQDGDWKQPPSYQYNPHHNVYAQDAKTVFGENATIENIPVTDIAEFVQKDSNKYIGKFITMQENKTKLSWNWSAALAGVHWCFYRKMIGFGIAVIAVIFSLNLIAGTVTTVTYEKQKPEIYNEYVETVSQFNEAIAESSGSMYAFVLENSELYLKYVTSPIYVTSLIISVALSLLTSVFMGFFGNYFYKKKVIKDIKTIRRVSTDNMSYHIYLKQKGNVSVINLLMPVLCNSILNMLISFF